MGAIDEVLLANQAFAKSFSHGDLPIQPARQLAVVTCMDARIRFFELLGLKTGDAHIIRNAGGIVTEDVLRSLIISHQLVGTREIMIINHTDCGLGKITEEAFRRKLQQSSGTAAVSPAHFYAFEDLDANVREQIQKVKSHPWVPQQILVRGFIYDVKTGRLNEVSAQASRLPDLNNNPN